MRGHAEQLPVELWLSIFSYLEIHDIFRAFSNLNHYFNQLLESNQLLFYVQLEAVKTNDYQSKFPWSNAILNRIKSLQSSTKSESIDFSLFVQSYSEHLIQLQSLIIHRQAHPQEISSICYALDKLPTLQYLCLTCMPSQKLLEAILAVPTLHTCQLKFWQPITTIDYHLGTNSNVEVLHIKVLSDPNHSIVNLLLSHMPKLRSLNIELSNSIPLFNQTLFILERIQTLKLIWNLRQGKFDYFQMCLTIMPCLKSLYLTIYYFQVNDITEGNLIDVLWKSFEQKNSIKIFLQFHQIMKTTDNYIQKQFNDYCRRLLIQLNNRSNMKFDVKLKQKNLYEHQIEVSVLRD